MQNLLSIWQEVESYSSAYYFLHKKKKIAVIRRICKYKDLPNTRINSLICLFFNFLFFNQATTLAASDKPKLEEIISAFFARIKEIENTNEIYVAFIFHPTKRIILLLLLHMNRIKLVIGLCSRQIYDCHFLL